jgi:hypothetical protein
MSDTVVLASRTVFPPEVDTSVLRLTFRTVWPAETTDMSAHVQQTSPKVQRPPGEVGKPFDGGFALKSTLGWSHQKYNAIRVSPAHFFVCSKLSICSEICPRTSKAAFGHPYPLDSPG